MDYWGVEDVSNNIPMGGLGLQEDTYRQAQVSSGRNFFNQYLMTGLETKCNLLTIKFLNNFEILSFLKKYRLDLCGLADRWVIDPIFKPRNH